MRRVRWGATVLLVAALACGDDEIPLGISPDGPQGPSSPGPQGPSGSGPGRINTGGENQAAAVVVAPDTLTIFVGDSATVVAAALDDSGQPVDEATFRWTSSDTRIARVREDATGGTTARVTGVGVGSAIISVTSGDVGTTAFVAVIGRR